MNRGFVKKLQDFGWIEFSPADMKRTEKALAALSEGSLDELGVSIIQDGFADRLFPGLTEIQTSLKYFLLIPAMLKKIELNSWNISAWKKLPENSEGRICAEFKKKLIDLQCDFCDRACRICEENKIEKTNIIGNYTANDPDIPREKRLVRFPHDIYWRGLRTFGLIKSSGLDSFVHDMMVRNREQGDNAPKVNAYWNGLFHFKPENILEVKNLPPLALSSDEWKFLHKKIKDSDSVKGRETLLEKLIDDPQEFEVKTDERSIAALLKSDDQNLTQSIAGLQGDTKSALAIAGVLKKSELPFATGAAVFAVYMRCAFLGFNIAYFHDNEEKVNKFLGDIRFLRAAKGGFDLGFLEKVAAEFGYRGKKPQVFPKMMEYFDLLNRGDFTAEAIRSSMIEWEKAAKGTKAYLEKNRPSNKEKWTGMRYLDFRLETALKLFKGYGNVQG